MELTVLNQVPRFRALIDSVQRAMKADPSLKEGYATLVSIFGNLDQPDSTLMYLRKGLARGLPRQTMATSLRSLIGALLREAQINDGLEIWEKTVPIAFDIDSAMSTPETKYLLALSISRMVAGRMDLANFYLTASDIGHGYPPFESIDLTRKPTGPNDQACPSIATVVRLTARADERMTSGGNRFAPEAAPAIVGGLRTMRDQLMPFSKLCGLP
jgi:hypothetical protein